MKDVVEGLERQLQGYLAPWSDVRSQSATERLYFTDAKGSSVRTADGRTLLDASAGMWCLNFGHGDQQICDAMDRQARRLSYATPWGAATDVAVELVDVLTAEAPSGLANVLFTTGGSTAVDSALRLAMFHHSSLGDVDRRVIISQQRSYHGSTFLSAAVSWRSDGQAAADAAPLETHFIRSPDVSDRRPDETAQGFEDRLIAEFSASIRSLGHGRIAAVIVEPVLGSGGVLVPTAGYNRRVSQICKQHGILLISDEVVTAFGRLGFLFASAAAFGMEPDMICCAKGLTAGYFPMGMVLVSDAMRLRLRARSRDPSVFPNGFTYSAHPIGCAAALATIGRLRQADVIEGIDQQSARLASRIGEIEKHGIVRSVSRMGLMAGIRFGEDGNRSRNGAAIAKHVRQSCLERGTLVRVNGDTLILSPALNLTSSELCAIMDAIESSVVDHELER